ncbi:MAG: Ig-like protein [Bacteroidetes bacterium]|jgi:hypothetical protein|nr:Ig-like protein [Bacteroidota bacterium]MDF2451764.1 Ig-like protein [Bacteroidota bacterium]
MSRHLYNFFKTIFFIGLLPAQCLAQGLVNNGGSITLIGSVQLYIDGPDGHYTSQASGSIIPNSTSTIALEGNWLNNSSNVAFTTDAGLVILAGSTQTIGGTNPSAFYNLSLAGNGIKTLAVSSTTVGGQSTYSGILSLGSSTLDLNANRLDITNSSTGAISRSSGYIISETSSTVNPSIIRWYHRTAGGSKIYPFGVDGDYIPFTFNITSTMTNTAAYVDVSTRHTPSDNTPWAGASNVAPVVHMFSTNSSTLANGTIPSVIDRWWDISNSDPITADLTFSYRGSENTLNDALYVPNGLIGAQHWDGTGWLPNNATIGSAPSVTIGVGSITAVSQSSFCPWILSLSLSPLPIELISYDGVCHSNDVVIEWCTASEKNNSYFTIEQSINNVDYITIGNIYGNGTSHIKNCYKFIGTSISSEINYFRLSQTDHNNQTTLLKTIAVEPCNNAKGKIAIANDGSKKIGIILNSPTDQTLELQIHNTLGQLIEVHLLEAKAGDNNFMIDLTNVSAELYYASVYHFTEKLLCKKIVISDLIR